MSKSAGVCTATHPIDLDDGRSVGPGESVEFDADHPHNAQLVLDGHLVLTKSLPKREAPPKPDGGTN